MLEVRVVGDQLHIGRLAITFHRTLRIPDDGRDYPLPPALGSFPLHRVQDFADSVPATWNEHGGIFLPMYQREAMWLRFSSPGYRPMALKVAMGMVNALTGKPWSEGLAAKPDQDYLVCPPQPWLDGMKTERGIIRQFVAMPLGLGYTAEGQITGQERFGGLQLIAFDPKPGRFPDEPPVAELARGIVFDAMAAPAAAPPPVAAPMPQSAPAGGLPGLFRKPSLARPATKAAEMGLGAGGRMKQSIYPDPHGVDTWDTATTGRVYVHLVNSMMYRQITGREAPATPVDAQSYAAHGYPWFDLYDEHLGDLEGSEVLKGVKSIKEMDAQKGFEGQQDDASVDPGKVVTYDVGDPHRVRDGSW